jgi:uncharacterized membrane protein YdbT with pleckstrin-like domain
MEKEFTFNGQRENEKVLEVVNSHPYVLYSPALKVVVLLSLALAIFLFFPDWFYVSLAIFLFCAVYLFRAIYSFRETMLIITDQRLFAVDQKGFFGRRITEVDLYKVLDITTEMEGFAKAILKYGNLIVRTAGARESGDMVIKNIPEPYSVEQRIANLPGMRLK